MMARDFRHNASPFNDPLTEFYSTACFKNSGGFHLSLSPLTSEDKPEGRAGLLKWQAPQILKEQWKNLIMKSIKELSFL